MTYTEIFEEVIKIMREDSATCKDFGAGPFLRRYLSSPTKDALRPAMLVPK